MQLFPKVRTAWQRAALHRPRRPVIRIIRDRSKRLPVVLALSSMLTACSDSPSIGVLGAYFPDWLFCVTGGVILVAIVHVLAVRSGHAGWLEPPAIVYPALAVLFSIALWAVGFNL